jgi:transcriptional regulator with XRE-family HTH domain
MISRIEELILKSGLKKSYIADKLEVSVRQIRNYETGSSLIPIDKGYILADLLKVKIDDLYERKKFPYGDKGEQK